MGTTVDASRSSTRRPGTIAIGHVGDSRAYRIRDGRARAADGRPLARRRARAHAAGSPQEEADAHPHRSVITRAVGTEPDVEVDTLTVDAVAGDLFLLCSDGLTDMVRDDEIAGVHRAGRRRPQRAARGARRSRQRRRRRRTTSPSSSSRSSRASRSRGCPREPSPTAALEHDRRGRRPPASPCRTTSVAPRRRRRRAAGPPCSRPWSLLALAACSCSGGARAVSARNRELLNLVLAALVASAAFASAWIAVDGRRSSHGWLVYVRRVIAGPLPRRAPRGARHGPLRRPDAAAARRRSSRASGSPSSTASTPDDAPQASSSGSASASLAFARRARLAALGLPRPRALQVRVRDLRDRAAAAAVGAGARRRGSTASSCGSTSARCSSSRASWRRSSSIVFLAGYLRDKREALARAGSRTSGPLLAIWGARDARPRPDERPRLGAAQLRDLPRHALRGHRARALRRRRARAVRRAARRRSTTPSTASQQRVTVWLAPLDRRQGATARSTGSSSYRQNCDSYQLVQEPLLDRERRLRRHRHRQGDVRDRRRDAADPVPQHRLRLLRDRARSSG